MQISTTLPDAYAAAIAGKQKEQAVREGQNAVRLIDAANVQGGGGGRPLPPDATVSVRA